MASFSTTTIGASSTAAMQDSAAAGAQVTSQADELELTAVEGHEGVYTKEGEEGLYLEMDGKIMHMDDDEQLRTYAGKDQWVPSSPTESEQYFAKYDSLVAEMRADSLSDLNV